MRLNGWQRIGVVLSVVWLIGAALYTRHEFVQNANDRAIYSYKECMEHGLRESRACSSESAIVLNRHLAGGPNWGEASSFVLSFTLIVWVGGFLLVQIFRWVKAGFNKSSIEKD